MYQNAVCARVLPMAWRTGVCVFRIVYLVYNALQDLPCLCTQLVEPVQAQFTEMYRAVHRVYSECTKIPFALECFPWPGEPYSGCTKMPFAPVCFPCLGELACSFLIVRLVYKALRDLPDWYTQLVAPVRGAGPGKVQSCIGCVRRCRLCQSASHGFVNWHLRFRICTPSVQGAMGPLRFVYPSSSASMVARSRSCAEPYSGCTNMLFVPECFPWACELACVFSESYT